MIQRGRAMERGRAMAKGKDIWCSMVVLLLYCTGSFDLPSLVYGEASLEVSILIEVKKGLDDPHGFLNNWNASDIVPCSWTGVTCDNASGLVNELDLSFMNLGGPVPSGLCLLSNLTSLNLGRNSLNGRFPDELFKCSNLMLLNLSQNRIISHLPSGISKLQLLKDLDLSGNTFLGPIPSGFGELSHLESLNLSKNWLNETIPDSLGNLTDLAYFDVSWNVLSGTIPPNLCRNGRLQKLLLSHNTFSGKIPETYGNCSRLHTLDISHNQLLSGVIPSELSNCHQLSVLRLYGNILTGPIPPGLGSLTILEELDLSNNQLSGNIPTQLSNCHQLSVLRLHKNFLTGSIPPSLGNLTALRELDLSNNQLSGNIPTQLGEMPFWVFDVSSNKLSGAIPEGLIQDNSFRSFFDNPGLCGKDVEGLIACPGAARRSLFTEKHLKRAALWIGGIFLVAAFMGLVGGGCFYFRSYLPHVKFFNEKEPKNIWNFTPFHRRLGFAEDEVLGSLDETNVIGSGGAGKVYKSTLKDGLVVVVKKLWTHGMSDLKHDNGFKAEVETLGRVRHKNIVKLLCCYSTPETKLLVYEYMPHGSLGDLLHGSQASILDWATRYKIALGAAEGLAYLHRDYKPQVLHCDVKSNNILLDSNYEARIADFGLARILEGYNKELSMSMIAGTYGYIAPEYINTWKVSEKSDIYSFGVVLLELVTGKRPVSAEYGYDENLVKWVCNKIQNKSDLKDFLDPRIVLESQRETILVLKIGLFCTNTIPMERPLMHEVVQMLLQAKAVI